MGYIDLKNVDGRIKVSYVRLSETAIKEIERFKHVFENLSGNEAEDRIFLQDFIDKTGFKYDVLYDGNSVYSYKKIMKDFKRYLDSGAKDMSEKLYDFFNLNIGTIAHYNKIGWMATYPTIDDIKDLFEENELGQSVVNYPPKRMTDVKRIVDDMQNLLNRY